VERKWEVFVYPIACPWFALWKKSDTAHSEGQAFVTAMMMYAARQTLLQRKQKLRGL
jgi:hypothetical protein